MNKLGRLHDAIRDRFTGSRFANDVLDEVKEPPNSERNQGVLQLALAQAIDDDPSSVPGLFS